MKADWEIKEVIILAKMREKASMDEHSRLNRVTKEGEIEGGNKYLHLFK